MTPAERLRLADEYEHRGPAARRRRPGPPRASVGRRRARRTRAQTPLSFAALLADVIPRLDRAGVPYMVTGSLASSYYGEPRSTRDLDIVIDPDAASLERLVDELVEGRFYVDRDAALEALHDRSQFNAMDADATKIDFVIRKDRPFSVEEFGRRERVDLLGTPAFVATAEDVVLSKLEWAVETDSDRQLSDAAAILAIDDDLDLAYIDRWAAVLGVTDAWRILQSELD